MKKICNAALLFAVIALFTVGTFALDFAPSIQYKDDPELVEGDSGIIITPISDVYDDSVSVHEDINTKLTDAEKELSESKDIIENFAEVWKDVTGGAPIENAIVSDIFDVRFEDEFETTVTEGKPVTIKFTIPGLDYNDKFFITVKESADSKWKVVDFTIDEDGVITLSATSMSVFAVIRDSYASAAIAPDAPDSPQTGITSYFVPAIVGAVLFSGAALVVGRKLKSSTAA